MWAGLTLHARESNLDSNILVMSAVKCHVNACWGVSTGGRYWCHTALHAVLLPDPVLTQQRYALAEKQKLRLTQSCLT
jgi:hypothetical protein